MSKRHSAEELFAFRDAEIQQAKAILATAEAEDRELEPEELEAVKGHQAKAEEFQTRGENQQQVELACASLGDLEKVANEIGVPKALPKGAVTTRVHESIKDDPKRGYQSFGDFAGSVVKAYTPGSGHTDRRLNLLGAATGMQQGIGADGGFAVPPEFSRMIWDGVNDGENTLLGRTDNYTVTGESLTLNANAETSRANGSRYGGVRGYWLAEADQITSSSPKLRQVKLEPQELGVLVYATNKLLRNATALDQYLSRAAIEEINFMVGDAIVNGDGVGKPKGLLNSACAVSVAKETSQAAASIVAANISKMWIRMAARLRPGAVWLANQDIEPELDNLFLAVTNVAGSENVGGLQPRQYNPETGTLKGRPVIYTEFNATLGTVGDLILVNLGAYATGTQGGIDTASSIHLRFDYAETAFRFMFAVDGQCWLNSAITPFKGSNTLSSVVTLATRA